MADADDKPLPNLDVPSAMEPLLKRIAEGVERLEKKQPPNVPASMSGSDPMPPMSASARQADSSPPNLSPQQFANAGNIHIQGKTKDEPPSIFGRAAISLQSMTNMMADYGVATPPAMHAMTSYSKVASLMAGDVHTRGEQLAGKGLRPNVGGDEPALLRAMQLNRGRDSASEGDSSPQIARNDLKDSLDSLKESVDQLKDAVKEMATTGKQSPQSRQAMSSQSPKPATAARPAGQVRNALLSIARPANIAANTI